MLSSLLLLAATNAVAASPVAANAAPPATASAPAQLELAEPNPKAMSQREIREFNATLKQSHPYYIRCVKSASIGSLVKRNFSCRTNQKWKEAAERGNDEARAVMDEMTSKSQNTSG
jgi:hypothetical protein